MNALGADPEGVLVPTSLLKQQDLKIGDTLIFGVQSGVPGVSIPTQLTIVGSFDLFPTWYPENGPIFVGNLNSLFLQAGTEYPHEVWLKTAANADPESIVYAIRGYSITLDQTADQSRLVENGLNTLVESWTSARNDILAAQQRPERQGLFGLLSVGFIASALLTVLGFLLYALFSFRRRFIEMGMLRAIGLSVRQMTTFLAAELASLILIGIGAGNAGGSACQPIVCAIPADWIHFPDKLSSIPDRDRLVIHFPDLWLVHPTVCRGTGRTFGQY